MNRTAVCVLLAALLAGCSDGGNEPAAPAVPAPTGPVDAANETVLAPPLPVTLELTGCVQLHTFFSYPVAVFTQLGFQLPPGFTFASSDGQTVEAVLAWWFCPEGRLNHSENAAPFPDVGSMFAALPVVPPSDLAGLDERAGEVQLDLVPLTWVISAQLASGHLGRIDGLRGGYVETGDVELSAQNELGALRTHSAVAPASFGVFEVTTAIQAASGSNPEGRYRMWLWPEGAPEVTSYLDIANTAGNTLGAGAAALRFQGDPETGAPPATAGTAHVVDGTGVVIEHVTLR